MGGAGGGVADDPVLDAVDAEGWYAQVGYDILPNKLQGVVKFETFDPEIDVDGNTTDVWTFGLNYLIKGHDLKAQLNYLIFDANGQPNHENKILLRMQAIF